ncbi:hypothetical protein Tco_0824257 [Tanacetum coccineum]|uniref:Uncharacterized protein n=1 Tax=Tanacetum coccineum TaxID=301880 RepID=A0ABQ5APA5_9ASTR
MNAYKRKTGILRCIFRPLALSRNALKSINQLLSKSKKNEPCYLIKLPKKSTGFKGVLEFHNDQVPPLHLEETKNSFSLVVVTLTAIVFALPNTANNHGEGLITSMREGLQIIRNIEECLNVDSDLVKTRRAARHISCACFTNLACIIKIMCHHDAIEKREDIVHYTAQLLRRSRKILEILKTRRLPNLDVDSTADIDVLCKNLDPCHLALLHEQSHRQSQLGFTSRVEIDPKYLSIQGDLCIVNNDEAVPRLSRFSELVTPGGLWVLIETVSTSVKEKLLNHTSVGSWFSSLKLAYNSFVSNERVVLISLEVLSLKVWTHNTFAKVASKWGDLVELEDLAKNLYFEMEACDSFICNDYYGSDSSGDEEDAKDDGLQEIKSQQIMMLREPLNQVRKDSSDDLKYPPGFTPIVINVEGVNEKEKEATSNEVNDHVNSTLNKLEESVPKGKLSSNNSVCSKRIHIETKIESIELITIETLWGDSSLDYGLSSSLGHSGAHETANKMSKLDRFLLALFPFLSALCLDRNLSDHRPILMRELSIDYGPTPFKFFHSWFNLDGFDKMIEDTWKSLATVDSNGMINLKKKLQALKIVIKQWTKNAKKIYFKAKISIQFKLSDINKILDHGDSNEEIISDRSRKRSQLAIRGTLVDGELIVDPLAMKSVFLKYFSTQFSSSVSTHICFADQFTNRLSLKQQADLERNVSNEEIKSAV